MTDIFKDGLYREHEKRPDVAGDGWSQLILDPEEVQTLYAAFLAKLLEETDLRMWPNRHLDCVSPTGDVGKTKGEARE